MIKNPSPAKMVLSSIAVGYTKALVYHSPFADPDTIGKTFWIKTGDTEVAQTSQDLNTFYMILEKLVPNTTYSVTGAYWDSMIDSELLANKISILISDSSNITTLLAPRIKSYKAEMEAAVVGVGTSYLIVDFEGSGQLVELQLSKDGNTWETVYSGEIKEGVRLANVPAGTYKARCRGRVALPDGFTTDVSDWTQYPADLVVNYAFTPPSKPTNLTFTAARILDGNERYDVQVKWNWSVGNGANIREFVLYYVPKTEFDKTGWAKAARANTGATQAAIITNFPWEIPTVFKVEAISWGPSDKNTTASDNANFTLNSSTPLDSSFTKTTGIEITYSHIKGQKQVNGKWEQTFLLNASDGSFSLGMLNDKGVAPISMDPVTGTVNVDGRVISNEIYAASVVLSNLTGQDNPKIYSTGKTYGGDTSGVWMGMGKDGLARFDVGNRDSFIRFDGEKIWMSAGVTIGTPNGDITIGDGITGVRQVTIYKVDTRVPNIPVEQTYPPPGWSKTPPSITDPFTQKIYASTGQLDPVTDNLVFGTNYSQPVQWSGEVGAGGGDGKPGLDGQGVVYSYQLGLVNVTPAKPSGTQYPPAGWSKTTPAVPNPLTHCIYATMGILDPKTNALKAGTTWDTPVKFTGNDGEKGNDGKNGTNGTNGLPGADGKGTVSIYQLGNKGSIPPASTLSDYPPNGWSVNPPAIPNPLTQCVYVSIGQLDPKTNKLVSGTKWATPVQFTGNNGSNGQDGKPGADGKPGTNGTNGLPGQDGFGLTYIYQVSRTQPVIPSGTEYPPTNWSKTPPANYNPTVEAVYASMGTLDPRTSKLVTGTGWSTPIQWSGIPANPVNNNLLTGTTDLVVVDKSNVAVSRSSVLSDAFMPTVEFLNLNRGKKITVSCFVETDGITMNQARLGCEMSITYADNTTHYIGAWYSSANPFSGVRSSTYTIQNKEVVRVNRMGVYIQGKTAYGKVSQVKLEEGNVATAWVDAGKNGAEGKPGTNGTNGAPGKDGTNGLDGQGVVSIYVLGNIGTVPGRPTPIDYPPSGWAAAPPTVPNPLTQCVYVAIGKLDPKTNKLASGGTWSTPIQWSGKNGDKGNTGDKGANGTNGLPGLDGRGTVSIYQLGNIGSVPSASTLADYPPNGWAISPPSVPNPLTQCVYSSVGTLDPKTNKLASGTKWSTPVQWTGKNGDKGANGANGLPGKDGADGRPGKDGTNGTNGAPGANGQRGPGFYRQGRSAAGWSDADATAFFRSTFNSTPVQYDVLTQYHTSNPKAGTTRQWNGSSWINPALMVHGDMVLDGTITSKKIVADQAFFAQTGINVIYDRAAALSSNPEGTYKMKIDLQNGSIHIR